MKLIETISEPTWHPVNARKPDEDGYWEIILIQETVADTWWEKFRKRPSSSSRFVAHLVCDYRHICGWQWRWHPSGDKAVQSRQIEFDGRMARFLHQEKLGNMQQAKIERRAPVEH
jgi:hypothetical protein